MKPTFRESTLLRPSEALLTLSLSLCSSRTLQMLAAIESRMEELFEMMESMPPDKIEAAEKVSQSAMFVVRVNMIPVSMCCRPKRRRGD